MAAGHPDGTCGVLKGVVNADEVATTECKFEWGTTTQYLNGTVPCDQGNVFTGTTDKSVSHEVENPDARATSTTTASRRKTPTAIGATASIAPSRLRPHRRRRPFSSTRSTPTGRVSPPTIAPHGGTTDYRFEFGTEDCAVSTCTVIPGGEGTLESRLDAAGSPGDGVGLDPNAVYHVRLVAENGAGEVRTRAVFRTYPAPRGRQLRKRARPPADRRLPAARLPRLRARLGRERRRL